VGGEGPPIRHRPRSLRSVMTLQRGASSYKSSFMFRLILGAALILTFVAPLTSCYTSSASRQSARIVRKGFDFDERGPWILVSGPGSLLVAGGNFLVASVVPIGSGVDPREPEVKWFHAYPGEMLPGEEVAVLCHRGSATWVTGIRPASGGAWQNARHERWHFPACIEALPGSYEIEVHYFAREADKDIDTSVSRQTERRGGLWSLNCRLKLGNVDDLSALRALAGFAGHGVLQEQRLPATLACDRNGHFAACHFVKELDLRGAVMS